MEPFVVGGEASAAAKSTRKRKNYDSNPDFVKGVVESARHVGADAAATAINRNRSADDLIPVGTIRKWLHRWKQEGEFWTKESKRGRRDTLSAVPGGKEEWDRQVDAFRAAGECVTGRVSSSIMRAVLEEKAPSLLARHGGAAKVCISAGSDALKRAGKSYRKKTTSRVLPPDAAVASARDKFYADLNDAFPGQVVDRSLLINFDQTFHLYNPTRGHTWEKKGTDRVQVRDSKDGFTLCLVVSAAGMIGAQMIFGNKVYPRIDPRPVIRFLHNAKHWSNEETTIALWKDIILPYVAARRAALGDDASPAIVLADSFAGHWTPAVTALVQETNAISYIAVPDCLTHIFQPLDLGIIAALKNSVLRRRDDFLESEVRTAVRENRDVVLSKSLPILRDRVAMWIKEVLMDPVICEERCCRSGFDRAGVTRLLYGDLTVPDVDALIPPALCDDCGEPGLRRLDVPLCEHFDGVVTTTLCNGCFTNHNTLCSEV